MVTRRSQREGNSEGASVGKAEGPTLFARMMDVNCQLREAASLQPLPGWTPSKNTPEWVNNVCIRYRQTVLKSVLKLKPGRRVNWRNYGRCIGLIERGRTFFRHDVPKMLKKDGLDRLSKSRQAKLDGISGEKEMREYYSKVLKRPLPDRIPLAELLTLASQAKLEELDKHRQVALFHIARQDAKTCKMFYKGWNEGYSIFINEDGEFSGDDRREGVYSDLLAMQYEVEKWRRMLPAKTRNDLRNELKKSPDFQDRGQKWFNDICDDIKLSMKAPGAPHKFVKPASSLR